MVGVLVVGFVAMEVVVVVPSPGLAPGWVPENPPWVPEIWCGALFKPFSGVISGRVLGLVLVVVGAVGFVKGREGRVRTQISGTILGQDSRAHSRA